MTAGCWLSNAHPEVVRMPVQSERHGPQRDRWTPPLVTRQERGALVDRQHCRQNGWRCVSEHDRRELFPDVAGLVRTVPHAARAVAIQQDGLDLAAGLDRAAGLANDG